MPPEGTPAEGAPEGAQAEESSNLGGLYDLASVPEDLRPHVEPHLKAIEKNVTQKFQENAEKLKGFGPYEELGITDIDPEDLRGLLEFADLAQDEQQFAQWWKETGERLGLFPEEDEDLDLDAEDLTPEKVKELIAEAVQENLTPVNETLQRQQQERAEEQAMADVREQIDALKQEHGDLDTDAVLKLAYAYADEDPENAITRGFEDYQRLVGRGEASLFEKKTKQPGVPEGPGSASNAPEQILNFDDAKAAAKERLRADRATA